MHTNKTLFGVDIFLLQPVLFKNYRIGLVTNNAALTSIGELSRTALLKAGFNIVKLFSPEHGLNSKGADGSFQQNSLDAVTGLQVISLYSDQLVPSENDFSDIDLIVFDIPDVGARFYTYLWTLTYIMEACAAYNKPLIILDRPNPLSGDLSKSEGPMLNEKDCSSFIGRWNIPIRHSCTYGELAKYFSATRNIKIDLTVIRNEPWKRILVPGTEWTFTPTSPAITDIEAALLYPGMGLLEGVNVNEGRGTDMPFKVFGAPWIDSNFLLKEFLKVSLPGISAKQAEYVPSDSIYTNQTCYGLRLSVMDAKAFNPVLTGIEVIRLIQKLFPENCEERLYKTVANPSGKNHLDRLTGVPGSFEKIKSGELLNQHYNTGNWKDEIKPYLLY
jgi:uncharacterized protein YbbC (DUF1343 family)